MTNIGPVNPGEEFPVIAKPVEIEDGKTQGVSPKALVAGALPLLAGLVLMALDLGGILDIEDSIWITMLGLSPVTGGATAAARTGTIKEQ